MTAARGLPLEVVGELPGPALPPTAPQTIVIVDSERQVVHAGESVERVLGRSGPELAGDRLDGVPWLGGRGRTECVWPDGSVHRLEFSATPMPPAGVQLVALRDVTGEVDGGPRARDLKHAAAADLSAPGRAVHALLDHAALSVAAALALDLTGLFVYGGPRRRMPLRAGHGWSAGTVGRASVSGAPGAPVGRALAVDDLVILGDLPRSGCPVAPSRLLYDHGVVSGLEIRIGPRAAPWGVLGAYARRRRRFELDELDFLRVVANALAVGIESERLDGRVRSATAALGRAQAQQARAVVAAQGAERRTRAQIMQLLHDEALQTLLAVRHDLAVAGRRPETRHHVVRARDGVQRAIRELRGAIGALHPVAVASGPLEPVLRAAIDRPGPAAGLAVTFALEASPAEDCKPLLVSVVRELVTNVATHACTGTARVALRAEGADLVLEVDDDGVGLAPDRPQAALADGHIGLAAVRRQVHAFGGRVQIESEPGRGTRVRVTLPGRVLATGEADTGHARGRGGGDNRP